MSTFERINGIFTPEAVGLKVGEVRSILSFVLGLILVYILQRSPCVIRLFMWLWQSDRGEMAPEPVPSVEKPVTNAEPQPPVSVLELELPCKDTVKSPPRSPELRPSVLYCEDDILGLSENLDMTLKSSCGESEPWDVFGPSSELDDLWSSTDDDQFLSGPETAVAADANSVLETALASGDAKIADAALSAGVRLCSSSWLTKAYSQLQAAGIPVMPERALDLIRVYGHERRADLAVDLWESHCAELGLDPADGEETEPPPASELYGAALEACARAGDFDTAARAAGSTGWRVPSCRHGQAAFLALSRWFARRQDVGQALMCYQAVRDVSGNADLATHRAVLVASVRSADMAKADALFQDLMSSGITPDGATFSAMICGHCSAGNADEAMNYFHLLRQRGIIPTAPLFDAILDGCAWMNLPALMEQVLADMEAAGVRPSTTTLSILMRLHGMNRDTQQALTLFDELPKKHGLKLDGHAYGTLISVCLKNGVYDMAWNAFERMSAARLTAHARIYEHLIAASLRRGYLDNAVEVVDMALGLVKQKDENALPMPRLRLQTKSIEDVLQLIGRRRQSARLGAPLVERLLAAGVELEESLVDALLRSAESQAESTPCSELHRRRVERQTWRNFPDSLASQRSYTSL